MIKIQQFFLITLLILAAPMSLAQAPQNLQPHYGPDYYFDGVYYYYQQYYCDLNQQCFYYPEGEYYQDVEQEFGTGENDKILRFIKFKADSIYQVMREVGFVAAGISFV